MLSPEQEKLFKSRPIGEDGKLLEKQIILSERYDKENPGLAGGVTGILETFGTAAVSWAVKEGLSKLWEFGKNTIMGKKESAEEKLDRFFMSHYETGLNHLENATMIQDDQRREDSLHNAANSFITAANLIETGCFVKAKSMLSVAGCHHLIGEYKVAQRWLKKAYDEGLAEYKRSHTRYELAQFESEIMVPLEKLLQSYPLTSDSTVPLLTQFGRLETGSSSSTSDNTARIERFVIVDSRRGDYRRISDAVKNVPEKTRILVRPGTYRESIVLNKNVEIVGDGPREQIVLISNDAHCIRVVTDSAAVVRGMTIHGRAKGHYAIDIPRGRFHLSDCIVTCDTRACIGIHNSTAQPLIENCTIRDGGESGIYVYDQGAGVIEDCDISNNKLSGVAVREGGDPLMRRCKIHDGQAGGIFVCDQGAGVIEDCDIYNNKFSGVEVHEGGKPLMRRCKIHDGQAGGIFVYKQGAGTFEDCDIFANKLSGVEVREGGKPLMHRCQMHDGQDSGIHVVINGEGTFEDCETFANRNWGLYIGEDAYPVRRRCTFRDGEKREGS